MKASNRSTQAQEPVGIVISGGSRIEEVPRFVAYIWGPAPTVSADEDDKAA
jgi:hypothetical protein